MSDAREGKVMSKELTGRVALVTGGTRGIGLAIAQALAERGADIAFTYVSSPDRAETIASELQRSGVKARAYRSDQAQPDAAQRLVDEVVGDFGKIDILVNNAGVSSVQPVGGETDIAQLDQVWAVNTLGVIRTIRAVAAIMPDNGRIITIGSAAGTRTGMIGAADYSGSKAAVAAYSRGAAHDLGARGITVNVIESGLMATEMGEQIPEDIKSMVVANLAIKRFGNLAEIASTACFLASPEASYITGAAIALDGGYSA